MKYEKPRFLTPLLLVLFLMSCSRGEGPVTEKAPEPFPVKPAPEKKTWVIGVSYQNLAFPYVAALQKAAQNEAEKLGVDASLQVAPYYNRPSQEGIYDHFKTIADSTSLPLILYNIPFRTGRNIEVDTIVRLAQIDNIVGIKEASGDILQANAILERTREGKQDFFVYSGEDPVTFLMLCLGGHGAIAAVAHVIGVEFARMCRLVWDGKLEEAREIHYRVIPTIRALFCEPNPAPIKQALNWMGVPVGGLRLPLKELTEGGKDILREALVGLDKVSPEDCK